ncbi:MAG: arginase family protein [Candidatus Heimdallarchaeota archaeon]|nr:MAG: arginase family protein [Candidatus Heimdallarchaeota archaeon]
MKIILINVPFHLGKENVGMGMGPVRYLEAGIDQNLKDQGYKVKVEKIQLVKQNNDVMTTIAMLNNSLGKVVKKALKDGFFPFILGGNCNTCLGTLAGFDEPKPGIIWFDAHGDFNTPETTPSGFLDGMGLAIATGQCFYDINTIIENMQPIQESWTLHIGARDLDPEERELLESTEVLVVDNITLKKKGIRKGLLPKLTELRSQTQEIYLHIDIDIIDPSEAPGVDFPTSEGLLLDEIETALKLIGEKLQIKAAALTAYNPEKDIANKTLQTGFKLINTILEIVENQ